MSTAWSLEQPSQAEATIVSLESPPGQPSPLILLESDLTWSLYHLMPLLLINIFLL